MREEELAFSYGDPPDGHYIRRTERGIKVRCQVGECPVMIDIRAQRFVCSFHGGKVLEPEHSSADRASFARALVASAPPPT